MQHHLGNTVLAAGILLLSVASYGQTPISSVPYTINAPGTYILTTNLAYAGSNGSAITVNAHDVSIDLKGFYLVCPVSGNTATGIYANNKANMRVENGEIVGFYHGVGLDYPGSGANLNFGHTVQSVLFQSNPFAAVWCHQSTGCVVRNCQIIGPGTVGVDFFAGTGNRAVNNVASGVTFGFFSDGTDYFDSNYADHCSNGIDAASAMTKFRFNTTTNCNTGITGGTSELANDQ